MKKLILFTLTLLSLVSCVDDGSYKKETYPLYSYGHEEFVPDSNKVKMAEWITKTVSAASFHMKGGDYEDPEDLVDECNDIAKELFTIRVEGLYIKNSENTSWNFIEKKDLTQKQKAILDSLKRL